MFNITNSFGRVEFCEKLFHLAQIIQFDDAFSGSDWYVVFVCEYRNE